MKKTLLILTVIVSLTLLAGCSSAPKYSNIDEFAQCLTDTGVTLYGTKTCQYCLKQKALFGDSFAKVNFVDCTKSPLKCDIAGVSSIPHRSIPSSTALKGFQTLEAISKATGCELISESTS